MTNKIENKPRMTSKPPTSNSAENFILSAENIKPEYNSGDKTKKPWEENNVREDVIKSINLRLSEPYILKIQFLSEQTNKSQQQIIREHLFPAIDNEIDNIFKKK